MIKRAGAIVLVLAAAGWAWVRIGKSRDILARQQQEIEQAWASAQEALGNRSAILPELAASARPATAAAIRAAEEGLRKAAGRAGSISASSVLDDAVAQWLVEVESAPPRPALDALKERLRETEFRFATERRQYNSTLQSYNVALEMFPNNLAARIFGFRRIDAYFITELPKSEPAGPQRADPAGR